MYTRPNDLLDGFPVQWIDIAIPYSDSTRQSALYGATVEVHTPLCAYAPFPEAP